MAHARVVITDWKYEYSNHQHSALGYQTPSRYAVKCSHR
jgi:hypothetical protein